MEVTIFNRSMLSSYMKQLRHKLLDACRALVSISSALSRASLRMNCVICKICACVSLEEASMAAKRTTRARTAARA